MGEIRLNDSPIQFQNSTFLDHWEGLISTIHDGIGCNTDAQLAAFTLAGSTVLQPGEPIVTFLVNRRIEATRCCQTYFAHHP